MSVKKEKLIDYLFAGSIFQEQLVSQYYTCVKSNSEKSILTLHSEISDNLDVTNAKGIIDLMVSMIIQTLFTNFSLCYEVYRDNNDKTLKSKTLQDLQITLSKVIKMNNRGGHLVDINIQDCRLFEFMNHIRNSISHCNFELAGDVFQFRDVNPDTGKDTFKAEFSVEELLDIYKKWRSFFITYRLNAN